MSEEDPLAPLRRIYPRLKAIRTRKDLSLKPNRYLKEEVEIREGESVPLSIRYYQVQAILHLVSMARFVLGDDTGTGKTLTTIASMSYVWDKTPEKKALVLTTKSAVQQWAGEFEKFTEGIKVFTVDSETPKKRTGIYEEFLAFDEGTPCVLVSNHAKARVDFLHVGGNEDLGMRHWDLGFLVVDEVTAIKNPRTKLAKNLRLVADKAERVWGLSATIIKNNLEEGYGIYRTVVPGLFGTRNAFLKKYCQTRMQKIPGSNRQIPVITGYSDQNIDDFKSKIDPYFIGRAKIDVADEMPVLTTREITVGLSNHQRELYDEALSGFFVVGTEEGEEEREVTPLTAVTYCQQIVNHPQLVGREGTSDKFDALIDLLLEGDLADDKVIIFSRFKGMVDLIVPYLNQKRKNPNYAVRVTGAETKASQRREAQQKFQDPKSDTHVICITMAGSDAINLQSAKAIIFYDLPFSAGDYLQILGRMIRLGSTHGNVYAIHMVARGTIDRRTSQILAGKMDVFEKVLGKRIKGDGDGTVRISSGSGLNDLFNLLREDAYAASGIPLSRETTQSTVGRKMCSKCGKNPPISGAPECMDCMF